MELAFLENLLLVIFKSKITLMQVNQWQVQVQLIGSKLHNYLQGIQDKNIKDGKEKYCIFQVKAVFFLQMVAEGMNLDFHITEGAWKACFCIFISLEFVILPICTTY